MARVDRLKEEIGWLKVPFGLLAVIDASLLGWLAQSYGEPCFGVSGWRCYNRRQYQPIRDKPHRISPYRRYRGKLTWNGSSSYV